MYYVLFLYGAVFAVVAVILVFLIIKRVKDKKKETFEKRDY